MHAGKRTCEKKRKRTDIRNSHYWREISFICEKATLENKALLLCSTVIFSHVQTLVHVYENSQLWWENSEFAFEEANATGSHPPCFVFPCGNYNPCVKMWLSHVKKFHLRVNKADLNWKYPVYVAIFYFSRVKILLDTFNLRENSNLTCDIFIRGLKGRVRLAEKHLFDFLLSFGCRRSIPLCLCVKYKTTLNS